jgi:hypothetical protein
MMYDRETLLGRLVVGDIFYAAASNGASMICLTVSVTGTTITARRVITEEHLEFDRRTGMMALADGRAPCTINSVAPLPIDVHNVILGIDRKFRLENDSERIKLNDAEKNAIILAASHYASHPI